MNEAEWLVSTDQQRMLQYLTHNFVHPAGPFSGRWVPRDKSLVSERQLRLFAVACCRAVWPLLTDPRSRKAVEVAERFADGLATWDELEQASIEDAIATVNIHGWAGEPFLRDATQAAIYSSRFFAIAQEARVSPAIQTDLLREIFGNPFRSLPVWKHEGRPGLGPIDDLLTNWITPQVLALATAAYEERGRKCERCLGHKKIRAPSRGVPRGAHPMVAVSEWTTCPYCHGSGRTGDGHLSIDTLGILSDRLEEAGCDNADILMHLRGLKRCPKCLGSGGKVTRYLMGGSPIILACQACIKTPGWVPCPAPHYRGMWSLDLVIGRS